MAKSSKSINDIMPLLARAEAMSPGVANENAADVSRTKV